MAKSNNGKVHNVYLLDVEKIKSDYSVDTLEKSIELLIEEANDKLPDNSCYEPQIIRSPENFNGFLCLVYYASINGPQRSIQSFFSPFVEENESIVNAWNTIPSFLMFLYTDNNLFCITGGNGYHVISKYTVPKFGLIIMSNFVEDYKISSFNNNPVDSTVHANRTTYRRETMFQSVDSWNTIFREMIGKIEDFEIIRQFISCEKDEKKKSINITAKDSIQVGNRLNINKLTLLLKKCEELLKKSTNDKFNIFIALDGKKDNAQILKNNNVIGKELYASFLNYKTNSLTGCKFDFFCDEIDKFIKCTEINVYYKGIKIFDEQQTLNSVENTIFEAFLRLVNNETLKDTELDFSKFLLGTNIACFADGSTIPDTDQSIISHISGEIEENKKKYFVIYGRYYLIEQGYIDYLNKVIKSKMTDDLFIDEIETKWKANEDVFNAACRDTAGFIHLHKLKPNYIEFCDLMKVVGDKVMIVHVKDGFDGNMRDLSRQVELSHRCLQDLKNSNKDKYFSKLYDSAIASANCKLNLIGSYSKEEFISMLKEKTPIFIIALNTEGKNLKSIEKFDSNIAKHCLYDLIHFMQNNDKPFKIQIISR